MSELKRHRYVRLIKIGEFYELVSDFYHWLRRCTGDYMERNLGFWYCLDIKNRRYRIIWIFQKNY